MNRRAVIIVSLVSLLIVGLVAFFIYYLTVNQRKTDEIAIADAQQPVFGLIYVAQSRGFFEDNGLKVNLKKFMNGKEALNDVLTGSSDLATAHQTPYVYAVLEGKPVSVITTLHSSTGNIALVAKRNEGISTINDLRGRRVAYPKRTCYDFFIHSLLISQGYTIEDIQSVDTPQDQLLNAFASDEVDAVIVSNFLLFTLENNYSQDDIQIIYDDTYIDISFLVGDRDHTNLKSREVGKFISALVQAENYVKDYPDDSIKIINETLETTNPDYLKLQWLDINLSLALNNLMLSLLNRESQWLRGNGIFNLESNPDFKESIDKSFMEKLDPDSVTL